MAATMTVTPVTDTGDTVVSIEGDNYTDVVNELVTAIASLYTLGQHVRVYTHAAPAANLHYLTAIFSS